MSIQDDVLLSWYDSIVELYELDLTPITTGVTSNKFYFTNQTTASGTKIRWKATGSGTALVTYEPLPIMAEGFEKTTKGQIPQPTMTVANIFGTFTEALGDLDDLVGARVKRRRTLAKYLGDQPGQDLNAEFPTDEFFIERKVAETNISVTFALASPLDLEGLQLPRRIVTQNICLWKYRGADCGYAGPPVANVFDEPPVPASGVLDAASVAYLAAVRDYINAIRSDRTARAALSIATDREAAACAPGGVSVEDTAGVWTTGTPWREPDQPTFAIMSGSTRLVLYWDGDFKPESNTEFRPSPLDRDRMRAKVADVYRIRRQATASGSVDEQYNITSASTCKFIFKDEGGNEYGVWNGDEVTISGGGYPRYTFGAAVTSDSEKPGPVQMVQKLNPVVACDRAGSGLTAASGAAAATSATLVAASGAYAAALAALPSGSALYAADQCGKRLSSCQLRFPGQPLPFGGFPAANIQR